MSFDRALMIVLEAEGGYSNDARDPGGETRWGISKRSHPDVDIKNLTLEQARDIYRNQYWVPCGAPHLPWPLSLYVFDGAVNQGLRPAVKMLQAVCGVAMDGIVGPKTIAAANRLGKDGQLLYLATRGMRYSATSHWLDYGRGWLKRLLKLVAEA